MFSRVGRALGWIVVVLLMPGAAVADPAAMGHWAFQPVARPALPTVRRNNWPRTALDRFILSALEREQLSPRAPAERRTLIRRLKFDLLGLPPTPEEVTAFMADQSPDAYERLVERYLAVPHFGERWARHWLDVVRFAESHGFEMNQPRPNAWPYRDYVIRAFNDDKPYDRFIREQLAGDLLGADEATGFLVAGPWDQVKSPEIGLTLQQRADELHDMVSVTGSAFLGLTVGCARCHDHKFDPVSQLDYHAVKAIFAGVQHGERALTNVPGREDRRRQIASLRNELVQLERRLFDLEPQADPHARSPRRQAVNARGNTERFAPIAARYVRFTIAKTNSAEPCLDELELFASGPVKRNLALATLGVKATSSGDYPGAAIHKLAHINDGKYGNSQSWISNRTGAGWVQLELPQVVTLERIDWARDREGKFSDRLPIDYRIEVAVEPGQWRVVASSADRAPFGTAAALSQEQQAVAQQREELQQRLAALQQTPMIYSGKFAPAEPVYRLHRGDPLQKREPIAPGALADFGRRLALTEQTPEAQRRQALAEWIVDPRNPLTARVIVNRLWHHHFGQGLVATPSDFGRNGGRPSHPELLDWLAAELVRSGWSLKHLHRHIVLSATYRQGSSIAECGLRISEFWTESQSEFRNPQLGDASNRLLWRMNRRRLEAEPLRDAVLAISGTLDTRMGGAGFDLFEPNSNYVRVFNPKQNFGPGEWRRLVYQNKPRMQLDDTFGSFDCPDAGQVAPNRYASTTPLQALNLLNSRFLVQQANLFAERVRREAGADIGKQVQRAFQLALQRAPAVEEAHAAVDLARTHGMAALCRALLNANEFIYID